MHVAMYIFGILTFVSACGVVFSRKSLHSALSLVATLFLVAVHFALLEADFLATLQVLIYAGAIMVLVVFVIMLLGLDEQVENPVLKLPALFAALLCGIFAGVFVYVFSKASILFVVAEPSSPTVLGDAHSVARLLFTEYIFPFEVVGVLLLAAVIGAALLAREDKRPLLPGRGLKAKRKEFAPVPDDEPRAESRGE